MKVMATSQEQASTPTAPAGRGPVTATERSLAPDLARGAMLLLIALANTPWYLYGQAAGLTSIHPSTGSGLDRFVQSVIIVAVDSRIYPMFAFLFGYGIVQLYRRQIEAGVSDPDARRLLQRRHLWMLMFGFVHAALLWMGDIVGAYGLVGLVIVALFFRRTNKTLIVWASVLTGLLTLFTLLGLISLPFIPAQEAETFNFLEKMAGINSESNYPTSVLLRVMFWPLLALFQGIISMVVPVMLLLAFWAARHRILENPGEHLPLLRRTAIIGLGIAVAGGVPHAMYHLGALEVGDHVSWIFTATQSLTGLFGGLGYVALFALIAHRIQGRPVAHSLPVVAIGAVGKRSLSSYLGQSVLFAPLLAAWGLGLGGHLNSAATAAIAIGGWLVLAVAAYLCERRGIRGPAEKLLRRLVYR